MLSAMADRRPFLGVSRDDEETAGLVGGRGVVGVVAAAPIAMAPLLRTRGIPLLLLRGAADRSHLFLLSPSVIVPMLLRRACFLASLAEASRRALLGCGAFLTLLPPIFPSSLPPESDWTGSSSVSP